MRSATAGEMFRLAGGLVDSVSNVLNLLKSHCLAETMAKLWFSHEEQLRDAWDRVLMVLNEIPLAPLLIRQLAFAGGVIFGMIESFFSAVSSSSSSSHDLQDKRYPKGHTPQRAVEVDKLRPQLEKFKLGSEVLIPQKFEFKSGSEVPIPEKREKFEFTAGSEVSVPETPSDIGQIVGEVGEKRPPIKSTPTKITPRHTPRVTPRGTPKGTPKGTPRHARAPASEGSLSEVSDNFSHDRAAAPETPTAAPIFFSPIVSKQREHRVTYERQGKEQVERHLITSSRVTKEAMPSTEIDNLDACSDNLDAGSRTGSWQPLILESDIAVMAVERVEKPRERGSPPTPTSRTTAKVSKRKEEEEEDEDEEDEVSALFHQWELPLRATKRWRLAAGAGKRR